MKFKDNGTYDAATKTAIIMRDGVYTYLAGEFPETMTKDADPERKLRVYRSPESVRAAYKRFKELGKIPVVFEHPEQDLALDDFTQGYGYDPELVEDGINLAIKCKLKLNDESLEAYKEGIREISCGWSGDFIEAKDKNAPYDYEQTFDEFNHIALVPEGRCGTLCSIKDQKCGVHMKVKKVKDRKKPSLAKVGKYLDEIAQIAKSSEEIEDSHAEGLLTAIQGLKEAISGFEAFAKQENMEGEPGEMQDEDPDKLPEKPVKTEEVVEDEDPDTEEDDDTVVEDEDVDKRKLIEEADAIAMKPADEFKGGAEEKFRTLTKKLETLGYNPSSRGTMNDARARVLDSKTKLYLRKRINDAANLGMKLAVKRFHDVLPYIADGTIPFEDVKPGMTPCEIKQKFVQERTGKRYTDAKTLNVAFDLATKATFNDAWKSQGDFRADVLDEKADAVDMIGVRRKTKGDK